jgi:GTP-binding protein
MIIHKAEYTNSYVDWQKCPESNLPEYAFIGRSNVGKSSLINMITQRNSLAKVSNTPGKTQCINYFDINGTWNLVDLPGYGYAKTARSNRHKWMKMIKDYIEKRKNLIYVFQLIDARISPQEIDLNFMRWMGEKGIPFVIIFTKNDYAVKNKGNRQAFEKEMLKHWESLPPRFITSSAKNIGGEQILDFIEKANQEVKELGIL